MKFIVTLLLVALLSFAICLYLPWWSIAVVAFMVSVLLHHSPFLSFLSGFLALFLLWFVMTLVISSQNDHVLAHRMSLLMLKIDNPYLLMLVTAFIGGTVAGLAALSGSFVRKRPIRGEKTKEAADIIQ